MPRGAIAKRSKSPGAAGPPGPSGLGVLAFPSIAAMSAFPMGTYVDGVDAHVLTLDDMWSYDPTSTLAPDVSAAAPLGITIVSANGPGNWTRREETSRRWRDRNAWFVDPTGGSDEAEGDTALAAIGTFAEFLRRVQGEPMGSTSGGGYDVTILGDVIETIVIDTRAFSAAEPLYIHPDAAAPIILFAGTITAHVDYNDATSTVGTITCAGLPVSWTASGLVGKLVIIPSTGVRFWIMQDMGAKTARISQPQAGPVTLAFGAVTNVAFEVYDLLQFGSTVAVISEGGIGSQVDFEMLQLGSDLNTHGVLVKGTSIQAESCFVEGLESLGGSDAIWYNCSFLEFRAEGGAVATLGCGYCPPLGGAVQIQRLGAVRFTRFVSYTTFLVQSVGVLGNAVANGWLLHVGAFPATFAFQVEPLGMIDVARGAGSPVAPSRLWSVDQVALTTGIFIYAAGRIVYDHSKPPRLATPNVELQIGNITKTIAQLPYSNPIDQAIMVEIDSPNSSENGFTAVVADVNILPAAGLVVLITQNIIVNGLRDVLFDVAWSMTCIATTNLSVTLYVDGVLQVGSGFSNPLLSVGSGSMRWLQSLAAGAHVIEVKWQVFAGQAFCRPVAQQLNESASVTTRELYG